MDKIFTSLGFMSGTSLDGIDVALINTDGFSDITRHGGLSVPYDPAIKERLRAATHLAQSADEHAWPLSAKAEMPADVSELQTALVEAHIEAADKLLGKLQRTRGEIDIIGFHGQTLLHKPESGFTLQLGDGSALAGRMGAPLIGKLRHNDMAHQGQGAPLAPIYHQALIDKLIGDETLAAGPYVFVNIGGVSNVTYIGNEEPLLAFDTGPGNALIDDWVLRKCGMAYDKDGAYALAGIVDKAWVDQCLHHPYFSHLPPKSIDRDLFHAYIEELVDKEMSLEDGAASLCALTARSLALSEAHFPQKPLAWIISGGGQHNPALLSALEKLISAKIMRASDLGLDGDMVEAECFAYLAVRAHKGLPITFPGTTGVSAPLTGGIVHTP